MKAPSQERPRARTSAPPKALVRSEHDEQRDLFAWALLAWSQHRELCLMFAVPNGARTSISVAKRLKAEGLRAGVPDVVLPVARGGFHGLFIELKRANGVQSNVSAEQRGWLRCLGDEGYRCAVCFGFEQARETILKYLTLSDTTRE